MINYTINYGQIEEKGVLPARERPGAVTSIDTPQQSPSLSQVDTFLSYLSIYLIEHFDIINYATIFTWVGFLIAATML